MKEQILKVVLDALEGLGIVISDSQKAKITITNPGSPSLGDYATNAALILAKEAKQKPVDLAAQIIEKMNKDSFEKVEIANPGFINFRLTNHALFEALEVSARPTKFEREGKVLLEYFQPNIAKPLHVGHLRTAAIGDSLKRMMIYAGFNVESDTHMGDWGTQFGYLILAYKNLLNVGTTKEAVLGDELNKEYVRLNSLNETDPSIHETAKKEFVKLEHGDAENHKIWELIVDKSIQKFLEFANTFDLLPFDHHWPESFYEHKMKPVLEKLANKKFLVSSQGAQIVNLEKEKLGIAVVVKSDGGTTYLLRDLATFIFAKKEGFDQHLYVVDNRQSHQYHQLFAILKLMGEMTSDEEGQHIDYGFITFKGKALSTRKGNMVLAEEVLAEARSRVAKIIKEKNPNLEGKEKVIHAVSTGALKYYDLSHNRRSDFEFDWDEALDFEGNTGPYLQYAYARLSGILNKVNLQGRHKLDEVTVSSTERELILKTLALPDVVYESLKDYLPNLLANYLYELAGIINRFYHESPVMKEEDEKLKYFRLTLIQTARDVLGRGLNLLGIEALEEM
jgi:arginyl-tRNA synthetase